MSKIYLVQGDHWSVPGRPMTAHSTPELAAIAAADLVNILLGDLDLPKNADGANWKNRLQIVHEKMVAEEMADDVEGAEEEATVWILDLEVDAAS